MLLDTPRRFVNFIYAFKLDSFRRGRHIVRDDRGFRLYDINVSYIWIATISPSFSTPEMIAMMRTSEGLFCAFSPADSDGIPLIEYPEVTSLEKDPVYDFISTHPLDLFKGSIQLDGTLLSLSIRGGADADISFPCSGSLSPLGDAILKVLDTRKAIQG